MGSFAGCGVMSCGVGLNHGRKIRCKGLLESAPTGSVLCPIVQTSGLCRSELVREAIFLARQDQRLVSKLALIKQKISI